MKRWQILKNFQDGSPSVVTGGPQDLSQKDKVYSSVDLSITPSNTTTASQAIILAQMGYGTIDISYTLERVRHCDMKYNRPLYPLNKGKAEVEKEVLLFMVLYSANISLLFSNICLHIFNHFKHICQASQTHQTNPQKRPAAVGVKQH